MPDRQKKIAGTGSDPASCPTTRERRGFTIAHFRAFDHSFLRLKDGGVQKLFDKRLEDYFILRARFNDLAEQLERQAEDNMELIRQSNEQFDRINELEEKLATINKMTAGVTA